MRFRNLAKELFTEDVEERKLFRKQARTVWDDLISYFEGGGDLKSLWIKRGLNDLNLYVKLKDVSENIEDTLEVRFKAGHGGGRYKSDVPAIVLETLDKERLKKIVRKLKKEDEASFLNIEKDIKKRYEELLPDILNDSDRKSFMHEYTHYIDKKFKNAKSGYHRAIENLDKYFTDPVETNARFQSALSDFERKIKNNNKFKEKFESFKVFNSWFLNEYEDLLKLSRLNRDIRESYIKRLFKYWSRYLND